MIKLLCSHHIPGRCRIGGSVLRLAYGSFGTRKLFRITLATYSIATALTAFSHGFLFFALVPFAMGFDIGGEYAAINSAVDELIRVVPKESYRQTTAQRLGITYGTSPSGKRAQA